VGEKLTNSETAARIVGVTLLVIALGATVWAFVYATIPADAPSFALESRVVLRAEMALALTVAAAIPLVFLGRLMTGRFPDRISPQGAEWKETSADLVDRVAQLQKNVEEMDQVISTVIDVLDEQDRLIKRI
jgi:hypothetical protein